MSDQTPSSPPLTMDLSSPPHHGMAGIAPKFPPQNFEVPDINFSNSVTQDLGFSTHSSSLFSTAAVAQGGGGLVPMSCNSPSSGEDSDDLPLAQLAKRANPAASPSASASTTSMTSEAASPKQGSPGPGSGKKGKTGKKKKKKDPNEPQKPVSAYALFFRDTQATIKGHNPNASFGEISKIVASMWDQLDPDHKENYKKKTEMEKKKYLKQLAAYRASQVSQSAPEEEKPRLAPSPPTHTSVPAGGNNSGNTGSFQSLNAMSDSTLSQPQTMKSQPTPMMQQTPQEVHHNSPPHQTMQQTMSHSLPQPPYTSPPQAHNFQHQVNPSTSQSKFANTILPMHSGSYPVCSRSGCSNHAIESSGWDREYCSNDCVITHCRDIFTSWAAQRTGSFQVK